MSNKNNQAYTRHHYLQKAYLDRFTESGKIDVILRQTGEARKGQKTESIANIRGFYASTNEEGEKDGSLEGAFAREIESPAIRIINNSTSVFPYVPKHKERSVLASYVALQFLRTPESKRRFESDTGRLMAIEIFNRANNDEELKKFLESTGEDSSKKAIAKHRNKIINDLKRYEMVPHNNQWLQYIANGLDTITPILLNRYRWHIFYYKSSLLITGDHPVIVRQINQSESGVGFANADEIIFPLGKRHCLLLSTDPTLGEGVHFIDGDYDVNMINNMVYQSSYMEAYSPPSVTSMFEGRALGKRAITTMSGGPSVGVEFLEKYSGILNRERPMRS